MKSIQLEGHHFRKLWEMCESLFPELDIESIEDDGMILGQDTYIHWFEFCMTHLSTAIFNKIYNFDHMMTTDLEQEMSDEWNSELIFRVSFHVANPSRNDNWHPVDYLYEQFKKLN